MTSGRMKGLVKAAPEVGAVYREDLLIPAIKPNEALVRVRAAAICGTDVHIYDWTPYAQQRLKLPMVFGHEFSGEIVELGAGVGGFRVGDRVAGETHIPCGHCRQCRTGSMHICEEMKIIGVHTEGAFADYIAVPEACLWKLDDSIGDLVGAMLEPMGVAVNGLLSGEVANRSTLILGCGPIGLFGVAAAKACGASLLMAIDLDEPKLDVARKLGADLLVNTRTEDFVARALEATGGSGFDVIVDFTGSVGVIAAAFGALRKGGRFTFVGLPSAPLTLDIANNIIYKEALVNGSTGRRMYQTWYDCRSLLQGGRVDAEAVIGGTFQLKDYEKAFAAIRAGAPGKMLLLP